MNRHHETAGAANLLAELRRKHKEEVPGCPYGDQPHFVPPSFGQIGFYMCDPPSDLTNHTRCRPPYEHDHADHRLDGMFT